MAQSPRRRVRTVIEIGRVLDRQDQLVPLAAIHRVLAMRPPYRCCLHVDIIPKAIGSFGRRPMSQLRLSHFLLCPGLLHLFVLLLPFCLSLPLFSRTCQLLGNGKSIVGAIPCGRPVIPRGRPVFPCDRLVFPVVARSYRDRNQISHFVNKPFIWLYWNTGPSLHTKFGPYWQCPQSPTAHFILRSIDT